MDAEGAESVFEIQISGVNAQQEKLIRDCCVKELKSLAGAPRAYKIVLQRSGTLHVIDAPEPVRLTDLGLCLRQAFFNLEPPASATVHIRGGR
jgi:hypothetical protein